MNLTKTLLAAPLLIVALLTTGSLQAGGPAHLERQASRLERLADDFHDEVDDHFRKCPLYRELDRHANEMERLADHIHDVIDDGCNCRQLQADLDRLHGLVHHVEGIIDTLARTRQIDPRALAHLSQSLAGLEAAVHQLDFDVARLNERPFGRR